VNLREAKALRIAPLHPATDLKPEAVWGAGRGRRRTSPATPYFSSHCLARKRCWT